MVSCLLLCNIIDSDGFCEFFVDSVAVAGGITAAIAIAYWYVNYMYIHVLVVIIIDCINRIECFCAGTSGYLNNILQNEGAGQ